jgi:hypothetical protein
MTKTQLIETCILALVLVIGYDIILSLFSIFTTLVFGMGLGVAGTFKNIIFPFLIYFAFYVIIFFLLARNIKTLARFISKGDKEAIAIQLNKTALLHIVIIAACLITLLHTLIDFIQYILYLLQPVEEYAGAVIDSHRSIVNKIDPVRLAASGVTSVFLLVVSKRIAVFFGKDENVIESETTNSETVNQHVQHGN